MILYALRCACGHEFDRWFENMAEYDGLKGSLTCPDCGATTVSKAIMAPRVGASKPAPAPMPACAPGGCGGGVCPMMGAV